MMDVTEYWATLVSIIIGVGLADLLVNFHRLIHERQRVDWDPLPIAWALLVVLWLVNYWWAVATNIDGSRNARVVGEFALLLISPLQLFLLSASVLPRSVPEQGRLDMQVEWNRNRGLFFTMFAIHQITASIHVAVVRGGVFLDLPAALRASAFVLFCLLIAVRSRRLEWACVTILLVMVAARLFTMPVR